jgi:pimeloyl-ACP methyl ester carboxylesterase
MSFIEINGSSIEYLRIAGAANLPTLLMLHEGLGSVAMWRDFPQKLAAATACSVFAYSRLGYGASEPLQAGRNVRKPDFMHVEAWETLPALRQALGLENVVLFGHSDGGSIALLHAARHPVEGVIVMAPHVRVEKISITSIEAAKVAYETTDLRARLAKYHDDVDGAFRGWNDIWLAPEFRNWNIEAELPNIKAPILAMQGENDEYGSMYQIEEIQRRVPGTRILKIPLCGHSPHRDQPDQVLALTQSFLVTLPQRATDKAA